MSLAENLLRLDHPLAQQFSRETDFSDDLFFKELCIFLLLKYSTLNDVFVDVSSSSLDECLSLIHTLGYDLTVYPSRYEFLLLFSQFVTNNITHRHVSFDPSLLSNICKQAASLFNPNPACFPRDIVVTLRKFSSPQSLPSKKNLENLIAEAQSTSSSLSNQINELGSVAEFSTVQQHSQINSLLVSLLSSLNEFHTHFSPLVSDAKRSIQQKYTPSEGLIEGLDKTTTVVRDFEELECCLFKISTLLKDLKNLNLVPDNVSFNQHKYFEKVSDLLQNETVNKKSL
ncbi:hypothetical protein GEMRC1_008756 [Eukaryota sp. GEM-RC1]